MDIKDNASVQQKDIFAWFATGTGNLVVRARAGTGKTTTILEAITHAPESNILLAAFNKRIAEELNSRLANPKAQAKTLHAVGFALVRENWKGTRVDDNRAFRLARTAIARATRRSESAVPDPVVVATVKLAGLAKNAAPFGTVGDLEALAISHGIQPENGFADEVTPADLAGYAHAAVQAAGQRDGTIDFDDMVFLPVLHGWGHRVYDLVVIDEAQDMNATQLALAQAVSKGRIAVVGDDAQAIYGFRGADSNAIDRLKSELQATELPLNTTYRCPKAVVAEAVALVPDFRAADTAPEGEVVQGTEARMFKEAQAGDFIISRINAPLGRIALRFLRNGQRVRIEGRDIGKGLVSLVKRMKQDTIPGLIAALGVWQDREQAKLAASAHKRAAQTRMEYVADQVETIEALSDGLAESSELVARIESLFEGNQGPAIVCSSIHKSKGLEADRVWLLASTLYCNGRRQNQEERNIAYVGITRAKRSLVLVQKDGVI
jgi:ATP-dependent DNA helicase UvrD/PcrA